LMYFKQLKFQYLCITKFTRIIIVDKSMSCPLAQQKKKRAVLVLSNRRYLSCGIRTTAKWSMRSDNIVFSTTTAPKV